MLRKIKIKDSPFTTRKELEARINESTKLLELFDVEFAYYVGGKPYSQANGTVSEQSRIKKVIDNRIAQLSTELTDKEMK